LANCTCCVIFVQHLLGFILIFFMGKNVLEVVGLNKSFRGFRALEEVGFEVGEGEILGFLGPNGAGKTTTIQILLGILTADSGVVRYFGKDFMKHKSEILEQINFSSTYTNLPGKLKVRDCLNFLSYLHKIPERKKKIEEVIEVFKLSKILDKEAGVLSAGQVSRLNLAKSFLNSPRVLLLDEPTASLDPAVAKMVREKIMDEKKRRGISILFTSHNMMEVEEICSRVLFLNNGKIIGNDTPANLAKTLDDCRVELVVSKYQEKIAAIAVEIGGKAYCVGNICDIEIKEKQIPALMKLLVKNEVEFTNISIDKPTLEDYFLKHAK